LNGAGSRTNGWCALATGLAATLAAWLAFGAGTALAGDEVIRFGIAAEPNPPFTVKGAGGAWTGLEVDLRDAVCKQLDARCVWVETAWDDIVPALQAKRFDVIWSSMPIGGAGAKAIDFTLSYYSLPAALAGPRESAATPDAAGMAGKIIGVQAATSNLDYANKHFKPMARQIKAYPSADDLSQDLAAGRIDAAMADALTLQAFLDGDAGRACCKLLGAVKDDPAVLGAGVGGVLRKEDAALRDRINAALKAVRASGDYDAITRRYFSFDLHGE